MSRKPHKLRLNITPDGDTADVLRNLCEAVRAIGTQNATTLRTLTTHDGMLAKYAEHICALHEATQALQVAVHALADRLGIVESRLDHRQATGDHDARN